MPPRFGGSPAASCGPRRGTDLQIEPGRSPPVERGQRSVHWWLACSGAWERHPSDDVCNRAAGRPRRRRVGLWIQALSSPGSADARPGELAQELVAANRSLLVLRLAQRDELGDVLVRAGVGVVEEPVIDLGRLE